MANKTIADVIRDLEDAPSMSMAHACAADGDEQEWHSDRLDEVVQTAVRDLKAIEAASRG